MSHSIERTMARDAVSQMLADAGINRETVEVWVKEAIDRKIDKAIEVKLDTITKDSEYKFRQVLDRELTTTLNKLVRSTFGGAEVSIKLKQQEQKNE